MSSTPNPPAASDQAVIEVTTSFFVLAFVLYFCKAYVCIDGQAAQQKWGAVSIPVAPGRHQVEAWTNYFIAPQMGRSAVTVDAAPGTVTRVRWKAPWLIFLKGPIKITSVEPLGAAPLAPLAAPPAAAYAPAPLPPAPLPPAPAPPAPAPPAPAPPAAGGWHADPSGRNELRYHDGSQWTEHISNAGVAGTDRPE